MTDLITHDHNVLFLTLDSCRYDTFTMANTPTIDLVASHERAHTNGVEIAETDGNYTYLAHKGFFAGHIPVIRDDSGRDYVTKEGHPLWRVSVIPKGRGLKTAGINLSDSTLQDGYRKKGYAIRGFGGTTFFANEGIQLRRHYQDGEFTYFGDSTYGTPRLVDRLPMSHIEEIVQSIESEDKWFVFVNSTATHFPYHVEPVDPELEELIDHARKHRAGRRDLEKRYTQKEGKKLHQLQVRALEYVDAQLSKLLSVLPNDKPLLVLICGDHGESFGEQHLDGVSGERRSYWGHKHNHIEIFRVPLLINTGYSHNSEK
ncbi:hypothetical protein CL620_03925 [archaeon]|nr:hypothetical protein [archaeon]